MYEAKCLVMDYHTAAGGGTTVHTQLHALAPAAAPTPPPTPHHDQPVAPKWSQYQHLWRQHHMFINGKGKDSPDKKEDGTELWTNVEAQAAFLGPNLWDKTLPYDTDLKYVDLDEFLSENGMGVEGGGVKEDRVVSPGGSTPLLLPTKREPSPSPSETVDSIDIPPSPASTHADSSTYITMPFTSPSASFDPRTRAFSDEELKPQPLVKKSRKQRSNNVASVQFVPDTLKDEKYWARRRKNNAAAKRSRDARRMKENQIALRAGYLEKENLGLRQEMERLKKENMVLRERLAKFTSEI